MPKIMVEVDEPTQSAPQASCQSGKIVEMDEPNQSVAQHSHQSDQVDKISKQEMPDVPMVEDPTQSVAGAEQGGQVKPS